MTARSRAGVLLVVLLASQLLASRADAQERTVTTAWAVQARTIRWETGADVGPGPERDRTPAWIGGGPVGGDGRVDLTSPPGVPAILSAVLPGTGQLALDQTRGWIYLGVELVAWLGFADRRGAASSYRARYRDLAWERARTWDGPRQDGGFEYYETLTRWTRSGAFDRDPGQAELQPETDSETFNGFIWDRARGLFMPSGGGPADPGYTAALRYYRDRAYDEPFLWDWSDDPDAQRTFSSLIDASDVRAQQATTVLGLIIANRLIAAADAFLSARGLSAQVAPDMIRIRWSTPR